MHAEHEEDILEDVLRKESDRKYEWYCTAKQLRSNSYKKTKKSPSK
jgi:hypothetical protein